MKSKIAFFSFIMLSTLLTFTLTGCTSYHARKQDMVSDSFKIANKHNYSINVEVFGGDESSRVEATLTRGEFEEALKSSLSASDIFTSVVDSSKADYFLTVNIINVSDPPPGADMRVTLVTHWKLSSSYRGPDIWQEIISSSHTATVGDAFGGVNRMKKAIEGAAKKNIKKGIEKLSVLEL